MKQTVCAVGRSIAAGGFIANHAMDSPESIESSYAQLLKEKQADMSKVAKILTDLKPWFNGPATNRDQRMAQQLRAEKAKFQSELRKAAKAGKLTDAMIEKWEREFTIRMYDIINEEQTKETRKSRQTDPRDRFLPTKVRRPVRKL